MLAVLLSALAREPAKPLACPSILSRRCATMPLITSGGMTSAITEMTSMATEPMST